MENNVTVENNVTDTEVKSVDDVLNAVSEEVIVSDTAVKIEPSSEHTTQVDMIDLSQLEDNLPEVATKLDDTIDISFEPTEIVDEQQSEPTTEEKSPTVEEVVGKFLGKKVLKDVWRIRSLNSADYPKTSKQLDVKLLNSILSDTVEFDPNIPEHVDILIASLCLPPSARENIIKYIEEYPTTLEDNLGQPKVVSLTDSIPLVGDETSFYSKALLDDEVEIARAYTSPGSTKRISSRRSLPENKSGRVSGIHARAMMQDALGLSSIMTVVLPHSGIVAIINAPTASDLVNYQTAVDVAKLNVGRSVGGANYGISSWFVNDKLVDLFISKIIQVNVRNYTPEILRDLIDQMDIPTIAWALGVSRHPDGYNYNRTCLGKDGISRLVIGKINLMDISFPLNSRLSIRQKQHLENAVKVGQSVDEIKAYQRNWLPENEVKHFEKVISERKQIDPVRRDAECTVRTSIVLAPSNITNYVQHGLSWDAYLKDAVENVLSQTPDEAVRSKFISDKITASILRDYSHYIHSIKVERIYQYADGREEVTLSEANDSNSIIDMIDLIGNDDKLVTSIIDSVKEFISRQIKIVYGVPAAEESDEVSEYSNFIVPINPVSLFFILAGKTYRSLA